MDICQTIKETPIYKIKLWKDTKDTLMYIFVGRKGKTLQDIFDKLSDRQSLNDAEKQEMVELYGKNFSKKLCLEEKNKTFIFESIYNDDTVSTLMSKIIHYMFEENKIHKHQLFCWIEKSVINNEVFQEFLSTQIMKKKKLLQRHQVETILNTYTQSNIRFATEMVSRMQIIHELKRSSIQTVVEPLLRRYLTNGVYLHFFQTNPFDEPIPMSWDFTTISNEAYNLEYFHIKNNTIHLTTTDYYKDANKNDIYYFPQASETMNVRSDYLSVIQKADTIINEINEKVHLDDVSLKTSKCQINYLHLRINLFLENDIPLKQLFQSSITTRAIPFIKYSHAIQGNQYKVFMDALSTKMSLRIPMTDLNTWIEMQQDTRKLFKTSKSYIMFKMPFKTIDNMLKFFTIILFEDGIFDVKYSFKSDEVVDLADIVKSFKLINNEFDVFKDFVNLPSLSLHAFDMNNQQMEIVSMRTNVSASSKEQFTFDDMQHFVEKLVPYFNVIDTNDDDLLLQYKRINNYITVDNITYFLNKNMHEYLAEEEKAIEFIMTQFDKTLEDAQKEYDIWKESNKKVILKPIGKNMYFVPANTNIASIRIKKQMVDFKISIEGITDFVYHRRIVNLIKMILNFSHSKKIKTLAFYGMVENDTSNNSDSNSAYSSNADSSNSDSNSSSKIATREFRQALMYAVEETKKDEDEDDDGDENGQEGDRDRGNVKTHNYVMNELHRRDAPLFKNYSRTCQWENKRQPVVISPEELEKLDKSTYQNYIQYGTTPERMAKNIYICPEVWCPLSRVSMTFQQYEDNDKKCPQEGEDAISFYDEYWKVWVKDKNGAQRRVMGKRYVSHLDTCAPCCFKRIQETKNKKCQDDQKKEDSPAIDEYEAKNDNYIVGAKYPLKVNKFGILPLKLGVVFKNRFCGTGAKGTGMINASTACFVRKGIDHYIDKHNQSFMSALQAVLYPNTNTLDIGKDTANKAKQKQKKSKKLTGGDSPKDNKPKTGKEMKQFLIENISIAEFLLVQNGQLCSMFIDDTRNIYQQEEFQAFKSYFIPDSESRKYKRKLKLNYIKTFNLYDVEDALHKCPFEKLDKYNIKKVKHFKKILREYLIYNSYSNFIKYLEDDTIQKTHDVLLDLCLMNASINPEKMNVLVIDIQQDNAVYLDCPFNYNSIDISKPFIFLVRQESFYEPIYYIKANSARDYTTQYRFDYHSLPAVTEIIDFFMNNCKKATTAIDDAISVYNYLNTVKYKIRYQVLNYNYKLVGFIVKVGNEQFVYVPCKPTIPIFKQNVQFIYIDMIQDYIKNIEWNNIKTLFSSLYDITRSDMYKLEKSLRNAPQDGNVKGLNMKDGTFIPLTKKYFEEFEYLENLNIFIGWEDDDPRKIYVESTRVKDLLFEIVKNEILRILTHHEVYKYDYEFLKRDDTFPIEFKRKKLQTIINEFMQRMVKEGQLDLKLPVPEKECSAFSKKQCNDMCSWEDDRCKLTLPQVLIDQFTGRIADFILNVHQKYFPKNEDYKKVIQGQEKQITFKQSDVSKGRFHKIVAMLENPYLYMSKVLDDYIKTLDKDIIVRPMIKTEDVFSNDWRTPPSPHNEKLNGKSTFDCDKSNDGFCINKQDVFVKDYLFTLFCYVYKLTNAKFKWNLNIFKKIVENRLIKDYHAKGENMTEFIQMMKNMNRSFDDLSKNYAITRIEDIVTIMNSEKYIMSEYEIEVFANLIGIKFVILGRKRKEFFEGMKCLRPDGKSTRYILLFQQVDKIQHRDKYELIAKHKEKKQIIFEDKEYSNIKDEYLDKFCVADYKYVKKQD